MPPEVVTIRPQRGPQEMVLATPADIAIFGGAAGGGKSWALLLEPVRHMGNGDFGGVIFRRTSPEITNEGGLWDESMRLYPLLGAEPRLGSLDWRFPSGANIGFSHLQHDDTVLRWMGSQLCFIGYDELTHFTSQQFWYLLSRNRSTCGVRPYIRATCNPDAGSWVAEFIQWWIDQDTGFPIPERAGVLRWFVRRDNQLCWADTPGELQEKYPDASPKSVTFIPARVQDNQELLRRNPEYLANLLALPHIEQERLLRGNWKINNEGGEWPPAYFGPGIFFEEWPGDLTLKVLALDPSKGKSDKAGDYSAFVMLGRCREGRLWVDADLARRPVPRIVADGLELCRTWNPQGVGVEINSFQELLAQEFARQSREKGVQLPIFGINNSVNKQVRIRRLGPYLAQGNMRFKAGSPGARLLVQQLKDFPGGEHDDGPDAAEMALRLAVYLHNGRRAAGEGIAALRAA